MAVAAVDVGIGEVEGSHGGEGWQSGVARCPRASIYRAERVGDGSASRALMAAHGGVDSGRRSCADGSEARRGA